MAALTYHLVGKNDLVEPTLQLYICLAFLVCISLPLMLWSYLLMLHYKDGMLSIIWIWRMMGIGWKWMGCWWVGEVECWQRWHLISAFHLPYFPINDLYYYILQCVQQNVWRGQETLWKSQNHHLFCDWHHEDTTFTSGAQQSGRECYCIGKPQDKAVVIWYSTHKAY